MRSSKPVPIPWSQRLQELRYGPLTVLVWLGAAAALVGVMRLRSERFETVGLAQALDYPISTTVQGRLVELSVGLFQPVEAGDVVARLDDAQFQAQLKQADAAIGRLQAEIDATRLALESEGVLQAAGWQADLLRFQTDAEQRRVQMLEVRIDLESDRVEEQRLKLEIDRIGRLVEQQIVDRSMYDDLRMQREAVLARIRENEALLRQLEALEQAGRERMREFAARHVGAPPLEERLKPLREEIREQEALIEELRILREGSILRAPVSGSVSQVLTRVGQAVMPGDPVAVITERYAREVLAYLAEPHAHQVRELMRVQVVRLAEPERVVESYVQRVGPSVMLLPQQLWVNPAIPQYGRPVSIAVAPALNVIPGERVRVRLAQHP